MLKEFKEFALKGNMIDMAVGIVVGGAFGKVVSSLVADIIMPPIGKLTGGVDFSNLFINLSTNDFTSLAAAKEAGAPTLNYGQFANTMIDFVIISFAIFMVVKALEKAKRQQPAPAPAPAAPPRNEVLLEEIRDLLKKK